MSQLSGVAGTGKSGIGELHLFGWPDDWKPSRKTWERLALICLQMGVNEILAPVPKKGASVDVVASKETLREELVFGDFTVWRGMDAHVIRLKPGEAGWFSTADCPCIWVKDNLSGDAFMAHASRDCLLNEESIKKGGHYHHKSVVNTIMRQCVSSMDVEVQIVCGIAGKSFPHSTDDPEYGEINSARECVINTWWGMGCFEHPRHMGLLSLHKLAKEQFVDTGMGGNVPPDNNVLPGNVFIDKIDTYSDKDEHGNPMWHSSRRDWEEGHQPCNGILFVNR